MGGLFLHRTFSIEKSCAEIRSEMVGNFDRVSYAITSLISLSVFIPLFFLSCVCSLPVSFFFTALNICRSSTKLCFISRAYFSFLPFPFIVTFVNQQAEPQPDSEEHELKVAAINEEIKKIKDQIEVLRAKIDETNEARRGQGVSRFVPGRTLHFTRYLVHLVSKLLDL